MTVSKTTEFYKGHGRVRRSYAITNEAAAIIQQLADVQTERSGALCPQGDIVDAMVALLQESPQLIEKLNLHVDSVRNAKVKNTIGRPLGSTKAKSEHSS